MHCKYQVRPTLRLSIARSVPIVLSVQNEPHSLFDSFDWIHGGITQACVTVCRSACSGTASTVRSASTCGDFICRDQG